MNTHFLSKEQAAARDTMRAMPEKRRQALEFLFDDSNAHSPTDVGAALGKSYAQASSYACRALKPLVADGLVERVQIGRGRGRGGYRISELGWYTYYYGHVCRQKEHRDD
jgi:predicted ArsR family transcriptional regulator